MAKAARKPANTSRTSVVTKSTPILEHGKVRSREHLIPAKVENLPKVSVNIGRRGACDRTLLLLAYRHGLRAS
jgi:type 1 fimbriae regulatory protein FimB/type 1 fimbriae regulatory protein FimE